MEEMMERASAQGRCGIGGFLRSALLALPAEAVLLTRATPSPLPGTTALAEPQLAGTVLVDELIAFSFSAGPGLGRHHGHGPTAGGPLQRRRHDRLLLAGVQRRRFGGGHRQLPPGGLRLPRIQRQLQDGRPRGHAPDSASRFTAPFESFVNFSFTYSRARGCPGTNPTSSCSTRRPPTTRRRPHMT